MLLLIIIACVIALLVVLLVLDRSPPARRLRKRFLEYDQRYRNSLRPTRPWEDDYRRHW